MSSRQRKPSAKLLEIKESHLPAAPKPKKLKKSSSSGATKKRSSSSSALAKFAQAAVSNVNQFQGPGHVSDKVFCTCLGTDDGTAMIACENCQNWCVPSCLISIR